MKEDAITIMIDFFWPILGQSEFLVPAEEDYDSLFNFNRSIFSWVAGGCPQDVLPILLNQCQHIISVITSDGIKLAKLRENMINIEAQLKKNGLM